MLPANVLFLLQLACQRSPGGCIENVHLKQLGRHRCCPYTNECPRMGSCRGKGDGQAPGQNADRHQEETEKENRGKDQQENKAEVRIDASAAKKIERPESDQRDCRTCGNNRADKRERVVSKICSGSKPGSDVLARFHPLGQVPASSNIGKI